MHLSQHKLCTRKMELALEVKFYLDFHWVTRPWRRTLTNGSDVIYVFALTNGSDVIYVFPRCPLQWDKSLIISSCAGGVALLTCLWWFFVSSVKAAGAPPRPWITWRPARMRRRSRCACRRLRNFSVEMEGGLYWKPGCRTRNHSVISRSSLGYYSVITRPFFGHHSVASRPLLAIIRSSLGISRSPFGTRQFSVSFWPLVAHPSASFGHHGRIHLTTDRFLWQQKFVSDSWFLISTCL